MVRKRDAWTRARDRMRKRPKTSPPKTGWLISELAALSNRPRRTIAYYVQEGLLAKPAFRGTSTRYGRVHLLRLLCIDHFKREGAGSLKQLKERLDAMGEAGLLAMVAAQLPSAAVATALGIPAPGETAQAAAASESGAGVAGASASSAGAAELPGEAWRRVQLLPGLELLLAVNASAAVRDVAKRIQAYCARR